MKNIIPALCLLLFVSAQKHTSFDYMDYRSYYNKAEFEMEYTKNYPQAIHFFNMAFERGNENLPSGLDWENLAYCYIHNGDTTQAITCLENAVKKGIPSIADHEWLVSLFSKKTWTAFEQKIPALEQYYLSHITDLNAYIEMVKLSDKDQYIRNEIRSQINPKEFETILKTSDSININRHYQRVKYEGKPAGCFLMYHLYDENEKFFPFFDSVLRTEIFTGVNNPNAYCQWHDRQRMYVSGMKTQLYGEWNTATTFNPIEDIANVDKRRYALGLCSLRDYALMRNLKLPQGYVYLEKQKE
jgi:tetratricopeptide (TPR) repeat protein